MEKPNLLICGDSFAANWHTVDANKSWVFLLENEYKITNLAQAGCSEFKILKQLQSVNLGKFDKIIVSHTSPYRIYVKENPLHQNSILHKNSCFIYSDVVENKLSVIAEYFEKYFDLEYAEHIHNLILKEIDNLCPNDTLHITHFEWKNLYKCKNWINFYELYRLHQGIINHYDDVGNKFIYEKILKLLKEKNDKTN